MTTIPLSGIKAAAKQLDVTSNNIANVNTTGFKKSRTEFVDIFSNNIFSDPKTSAGFGVEVSQVRQSFGDGALSSTGNNLDMAIVGGGFFATARATDSKDMQFTRAGEFGVNSEGYITNSSEQFLMSFPVNEDSGEVLSTSPSSMKPMFINQVFGTPVATEDVRVALNLDASKEVPPVPFDPNVPESYTHTTSFNVFDSLGNTHLVEQYYALNDTTTNTWDTHTFLNGTALTSAGSEQLSFDASGALTAPATGEVAYDPVTLGNGTDPLNITVDFTPPSGNVTTQYASNFAVTDIKVSGTGSAILTGVELDTSGLILAQYSNGEGLYVGKIAMANFTNPEGLRNIGGTSWASTSSSGEPLLGEAKSGTFGSIESGKTEGSNVDIASELLTLIQAQRNFQANAKSIEAYNQTSQTVVNIS